MQLKFLKLPDIEFVSSVRLFESLDLLTFCSVTSLVNRFYFVDASECGKMDLLFYINS